MYCRLAERLGHHSQTYKQTALNKAITALLKQQWESDQLEPQHDILCLIYWLAQRPLESPWVPDYEDEGRHDAGTSMQSKQDSTTCASKQVQMPSCFTCCCKSIVVYTWLCCPLGDCQFGCTCSTRRIAGSALLTGREVLVHCSCKRTSCCMTVGP